MISVGTRVKVLGAYRMDARTRVRDEWTDRRMYVVESDGRVGDCALASDRGGDAVVWIDATRLQELSR